MACAVLNFDQAEAKARAMVDTPEQRVRSTVSPCGRH